MNTSNLHAPLVLDSHGLIPSGNARYGQQKQPLRMMQGFITPLNSPQSGPHGKNCALAWLSRASLILSVHTCPIILFAYSVEAAPTQQDRLGTRANGENSLEKHEGLIRKAKSLEQQENFAEAIKLWGKILDLTVKDLGRIHPGTAVALNYLAYLYSLQGESDKAESTLREALAIREQIFGRHHHLVAISINNLASVLNRQHRFDEAEPLLKRSLAIKEQSLGSDNPEIAIGLNNLGFLYARQGRNSMSELLLRRSLAIRELTLGRNHPDTTVSIINLASLQMDQGRYADAERLYRRSLFVDEQFYGASHSRVAASLNGLGSLFLKQGRYVEASHLLERSVAITEMAKGQDHPDTAISINNLAALRQAQGLYSEAEALYKRSLKARQEITSKDYSGMTTSLNNLGDLYRLQGRLGEAESLLMQSLLINQKSQGPGHPSVAISLNNIAEIYKAQGRFDEAKSFLGRALAIGDDMFAPDHPNTSAIVGKLAILRLLNREWSSARDLIAKLGQAQSNWFRRELPLLARDLRLTLLKTQPDILAKTFALLDQYPVSVYGSLSIRLNSQGLLAEIEQRQRLLLASSLESRDLAERLAGLDRQLASVNVTPKQRQQLKTGRQQLETQLYQQLPALRIDLVTNEQVSAALRELAPQGLLVEFQRYRPLLRSKTGGPEWGVARYVALTLRPDGRINSIKLGDAAPIDTAIAKAVDASAQGQTDALALWGQVSRLLLTPLKSELKGVQELFISPDSELNRIPFAALPVGDGSSQLLSEVLQLRILTTGRDLVRLQKPAPTGASAAVVMANPQFDARGRRSVPANSSLASASATTRQQRSATQQAGRRQWDQLPATEKEAQALAPLLKADKPITGDAATESRALALKSPRILHIASHGFFDPEKPAADKQRPTGGQLLGLANPSPLSDDPLLRSGLVLAGANHPDADPNDDGHLTAAEITGMDLRQTELVTLSACETGLGSVRSGEGVYGLQRALTVAGSRSTLLSLWKVDDEATASFMTEFYRRLMAGEGRSDALRNTQAAFRNHSNKLYQDVYVWGAFQLTGDWRPLSAR